MSKWAAPFLNLAYAVMLPLVKRRLRKLNGQLDRLAGRLAVVFNFNANVFEDHPDLVDIFRGGAKVRKGMSVLQQGIELAEESGKFVDLKMATDSIEKAESFLSQAETVMKIKRKMSSENRKLFRVNNTIRKPF